MFLISRMIYDPRPRSSLRDGELRQPLPNLMGLTVGLTVHTPKFWRCSESDFYVSRFDEMRDGGLDPETMEERYQTARVHRGCTRRHMSYRGYAYWTGPARRYTLRYMGPITARDVWWKPLSVSRHGRYVRWLDNGPQNPPRRESARDLSNDPLLVAHNERFRAAMERSRTQMTEYAARRDRELDGGG